MRRRFGDGRFLSRSGIANVDRAVYLHSPRSLSLGGDGLGKEIHNPGLALHQRVLAARREGHLDGERTPVYGEV